MAKRRRFALRFELLEVRNLLAATVFEHAGIGYFLVDDDPRLERFDIQDEQWLEPADELVGGVENGLFTLTGDFNGDGGVSIFDFSTFACYFGMSVSPTGAPDFVDLNRDGGVTVFDFGHFSQRFGVQVVEPIAFGSVAGLTTPATAHALQTARIQSEQPNVALHQRALRAVLAEWNRGQTSPDLNHARREVIKRAAGDELARAGGIWPIL